MKRIYLAGPISGLDYKGATDWRNEAQYRLAQSDILGLSPMRAKEFLKDKGIIGSGDMGDEHGLSHPRGFVTRDRMDVATCDAVLMNLLGATRVSIGTMVEIGWADAYRKPVILIMEQNNPHEHGFVRQLTHYHVTTLDAGLDIAEALFNA